MIVPVFIVKLHMHKLSMNFLDKIYEEMHFLTQKLRVILPTNGAKQSSVEIRCEQHSLNYTTVAIFLHFLK